MRNVVDRPELCDFTTPSILDRDPLLVAIGTGGASAGLAKHVRLRLERVLPETLGLLARGLEAVRPVLRRRFPNGAERRRAVDAALAEGGALDPLDPAAHERVAGWAEDSSGRPAAITQLITITSADPEDLTIRQARLLGEADVLLISGDVPQAIIARARADAERRVFRITGDGFEPQRPGPPEAGTSRSELTVVLHWQPDTAA
jgi:uroporphyrin-III C-methyltransferase / precorrin-2 dehydrogenase / sirohydrochlorin ferrochelatase